MIDSIIHGGEQEHSKRAGTENTAGIVGFGKAASMAKENLEENIEKQRALQNLLIEELFEKVEGISLNGDRDKRLPGNVHVCIEGIRSEALLMGLDMAGISVSSKSACSSGSYEISHVLSAMGIEPDLAGNALRFSIGRDTTKDDIERVVSETQTIVKRLRK